MKRSMAAVAATAVLLPLGTAPARAYTAPTAANVVVLNSVAAQLPNNQVLQVTGELKNNNAATVTQVPVRVQVFDASNALIGEVDTGTTDENLAPGMSSPFVGTISPVPTGYDHFTVTVLDAPVATALANRGFTTEVSSVVNGTDAYGNNITTVSGYVTNTNTALVDTPTVVAVYRDGSGAVADVEAATVNNPDPNATQDPGTKLQWQYVLYGDAISRDAGLTLSTYATTGTDPSPMTNDVGSRSSAVLAYGGTIAPEVPMVKSTTNGYPANDGTVTTLQRQSGSSWVNVGSASTDMGYVTFGAQRPLVRTVYRAVTLANNSTVFAAGTPFLVQVRMLITAALSGTSIHPTGYAYLAGRTSVAHPGQRIYLQGYYSSAWHTLTYTSLSSTSTYRFTLKPGRVGTYTYRVLKPTDAVSYLSASGRVTLKVA